MKEQARSQYFLALYNVTTSSLIDLEFRTKSKIQQVETDVDRRFDNLTNETRLSQYSVGIQLSNMQSVFEMKF